MTRVSMNIDTTRVTQWLIGLSAVVLLLGFAREAYVALFGIETLLKDLRQIALDTEHCIGSFYSSVLMGISALLMVVIGQHDERKMTRLRWFFLAFIFVLMSLDESVSFHEVLINPLRSIFGFSSFLHFAWIVPGALFVLAMGLFYTPFVFAMEKSTRNGIILAGLLYVSGALGLEAVGGHFHFIGGDTHPYYIAASMIEELLEIVGLTLFAAVLLRAVAGLTRVSENPAPAMGDALGNSAVAQSN